MDKLLDELESGELAMYELEERTDNKTAVRVRQKHIEKKTGVKLAHIPHFSLTLASATKKNIENMLGVVQLPMSIAGPLKVNGEHAKGSFLIPIAGTQKGLVQKVSRGIGIINAAGGAETTITENFQTRGPAIKVGTKEQLKKVLAEIAGNFPKLKEVAESTTRHGKLLWIKPYPVGNTIFLRFAFDTKDAMGMNMVTIGTDAVLKYLEQKYDFIKHIALSGNMCSDKKPAALNFVDGRGKSVVAEAHLDGKTTKELKPELARTALLEGARTGSYSYTLDFASTIAGIFTATGQDAAHVVESCSGFTLIEPEGGGLYCSVTLTNLHVGTIGGGTSVDTQQEALKIMGCAGAAEGANSKKLAEIIAAAVLAGELGGMLDG